MRPWTDLTPEERRRFQDETRMTIEAFARRT
jgi:hypothetical protein